MMIMIPGINWQAAFMILPSRVSQEGVNWIKDDAPGPDPDGIGYAHPESAEARLAPFRIWLKSLPEGDIVVVGHSGFFDKFLGVQMDNCELLGPVEV